MHAPSSQLRLLHKVLDVNTSVLGSEPRLSFLRHGEGAGLVPQVIEQEMLVNSTKTRSDLRYNSEMDLPCNMTAQLEEMGADRTHVGFGTLISVPLKSITGTVCGVLQMAHVE